MDKKQWTTRKIVKNIDANKERGKAWFFIVVPCPSKPHPHPPTHPLTHCLPVGVRCSLFASCRCQSRWLRCMSCCRCCDEECICNLSPSCHAHDHGCVCVLFWCRKSQWSLFSWSLHIGYAVAAHLTSTAPKRLNNSKNLESQQGSLAFLHIDFSASRVHNVQACSAVENLLKRVLIFSWCASWQHHISHFYDRRDENTQPCSVLVLQDWLRHHRVIILGAINSGLTKHRSYLKCFCVWTLKHLRQTQVGKKTCVTKRQNQKKTGFEICTHYTLPAAETKFKRFVRGHIKPR